MKKTLIYLFTFVFSFSLIAGTFDVETGEVKTLLTNAKETRINYCIKNTLTCRSLVLLEDLSKNKLPIFYNTFISAERAVGLTGYFLKNSNDNFRAYTDSILDGKIIIDTVNEWDKEINVSFDQNGFPTLKNLRLVTLGTSKYSVATLTFSEEESSIKGIQYDSNDPSVANKIEVIYTRTK